ncbi:MAG: multidrug effflux MFS transporter [Pseudomonadota bacterium]
MTTTSATAKPLRASARFIALMAFMTSSVAFGIDMMLASLPEIGAEISVNAPERAQLIVGLFFVGLGLGTVLVGPVSDAFGRRPVLFVGLAIYALGAAVCWLAPNLEWMCAGRILQGLGAAAPRVTVLAVIRDRFIGRQMAATQSLVMMIFTLVPGIAPLLGEWVAHLFGWRAIFFTFVIFAAIAAVWFGLQQPETLPPERRKPLRLRTFAANVATILHHPQVRLSIGVQTFTFAALISLLTATPLIFDRIFDLDAWFPYAMGLASLLGGVTSFINARIVERLGMVRLMRIAMAITLAVTVAALTIFAVFSPSGALAIWVYMIFKTAGFALLGFTVGNSTALAMQPMGAIAGTTASVVTATATLVAAIMGIAIAAAFNDTVFPTMIGLAVCYSLGLLCALRLEHDEA